MVQLNPTPDVFTESIRLSLAFCLVTRGLPLAPAARDIQPEHSHHHQGGKGALVGRAAVDLGGARVVEAPIACALLVVVARGVGASQVATDIAVVAVGSGGTFFIEVCGTWLTVAGQDLAGAGAGAACHLAVSRFIELFRAVTV